MLPSLEYIKQTRQKLGITQRRLASLTGISTSMINQIETGRCKPSYDTAKKIFEILSTLEGKSAKKQETFVVKKSYLPKKMIYFIVYLKK